MTCPVCGADGRSRDTNPAFPFCGERCRLVDLGNWLGESYRIAMDSEDTVPEPDPPSG